MNIDDDNFDDDALKSKTQVKLEMHALRDLGLEIAELPAGLYKSLELSAELRLAIDEYRDKITHKNARKRQAAFIGKLMRSEDGDALRAQLDAMQETRHRETRQFHLAEQWRDRLLAEEDAFTTFVAEHPDTDRQQLRSLIRAVMKEKSQGKAPTSARRLYKLIQQTLNTSL